MRANKILLMLFILEVLFPWYLYPQFANTRHQEMVRTEEKKPIETFSGPEKVNVNTAGKFSIEIPLLNVPQRDGKSFPLALSYSPGIKLMTPSTWVGMGFNLDIGSIRRVPISGTDHDVKEEPFYHSSDDYPGAYDTYAQRDFFMISFPGGSGKILQFPITDTDPTQYRFELEEYKDWSITYNNTTDKFIVITEDGTTYVFGMYLVGLSSNCLQSSNAQFWHPDTRPFMEWKLTAILGPDYISGGTDFYDPLSANNPTVDNKGNWIAIEYRYNNNVDKKKWNYQHDAVTSTQYTLEEITYPYRLITPTHVAEFVTEDERYNLPNSAFYSAWPESPLPYLGPDNPLIGNGYLNKRLKEINLYQYSGTGTNHESQIIKKTGFAYYDAPTDNIEYQSRTFLKEVRFGGQDGSILQPYKFDYHVDLTAIPSHPECKPTSDGKIWFQGDHGWYNSNGQGYIGNTTDGLAWNLKTVTYPTGGKITFDYESNGYMLSTAKGINSFTGHGPRLKSQKLEDGMSNSRIYTYTYSNFKKNPSNNTLLGEEVVGQSVYRLTPSHYFIFHYTDTQFINSFANQIDTDVQYKKITETCDIDQSKTVYWFTVRNYDDFSVRNQELNGSANPNPAQILIKEENIKAATLDLNGSLYKVENYNGNNKLIKSISYDYVTKIKSKYYTKVDTYDHRKDLFYWFSVKPISNTKIITYYNQDGTNNLINDIPITSEEKTFYNENALVSRSEQQLTGEEKKFQKILYSGDIVNGLEILGVSEETDAVGYMQMKGIKNAVIEKIIGKKNTTTNVETVESAELILYKNFGAFSMDGVNAQIYPSEVKQFDTQTSVTNFSSVAFHYDEFNGKHLNYDTRYRKKQTYTFNNYGEITETIDANDVKTSYIWDKSSKYKIAVAKNAAKNMVFFDDFEVNGGWDANMANDITFSRTGKSSGKITKTTTGELYSYCQTKIEIALTATKKFRYSGWVYSTGPTVDMYLCMEQGNGTTTYNAVSTSTINQWVYLEKEFDVASNVTKLYLRADNNGGGTVWFDDFRLYPAEALMTTQTYDPATQLVTSQSDENSIPKFYEYDTFNRLVRTKDYTGRVMTETNYYYSAENSSGMFTSEKPNMILQSNFVNGNLLKNWSFEESSNGTLPSGWSSAGTVTSDDFYSGGKSVRINYSNSLYQDLGLFKAGKKYTASVWFYAASGTNGRMALRNGFGSNIDDNSVAQTLDGNDHWQKISVTWTMTADRQMQVFLYGNSTNGMSTLYDNVVVEEAPQVPQADQPLIKTTYLDGLMKTVQTQTALGNDDIIQHLVYDTKGQLIKKYKPYQFTSLHKYDQSFDTHATDYYNGTVYEDMSDNNPFQLYSYLADGRIKNQKPEGAAWQNEASPQYMRYDYLTAFTAGNLRETVYTDENGNTTETYINNFDEVVKTVRHNDAEELVTSFEHDINGNILRVTSPKGLVSSYTYNTLGKVTQKHTPDEETTQYLYDKNGNLRFIKDANHGGGNNAINIAVALNPGQISQGNFTLNNPGKVSFTLNTYPVTSVPNTIQIRTTDNVVLISLSTGYANTNVSGSILLPKGEYKYYAQTTQSPASYTVTCATNYEFVYNKYDSFNRVTETGEYEGNSSVAFTQTNADDINFPSTASTSKLVSKKFFYDTKSTDPLAVGQNNTKGRISYEESYTNGNLAIRTFYSYNEMGNVDWLKHYGLGWYNKKITYKYNLLGNLIKKDFVALYGVQMYNAFDYDAAGRLTTVKTSSDPNMVTGVVQEAAYQYFASGKQKRLQLGTAQGVDYRYNERDWLTMINHQNLNSTDDPGHDGNPSLGGLQNTDKFSMVIGYNAVPNDITDPNFRNAIAPQWNGNVSWSAYNMSGVEFTSPGSGNAIHSSLVGNIYTYDPLNRLTNSNFGCWFSNSWIPTTAFGTNYLYDKDGNFQVNTWKDNLGTTIGNLNYNYAAGKNQLTSTTGTGGSTYTYDANGSVVKDPSKNISFIIYDINNLPITVYTATQKIIYSYDAAGNRVRKLIVNNSTGATVSDISYVNGADGKTEAIAWSYNGTNYTYNIWGNDMVGQIRMNGSSVNRFYYLKDHLGTIRMTVDAAANIVGYDDYYPYGMVMPTRSSVSSSEDARYKFTMKERDAETTYDYFGARYYDSRVGRWLSVDPLAEKYPNWSPYNYCLNNPLAIIDPNGMDTLNITLNKNRDVPGTAELIVNGESVELQGGNEVLGRGSKNKKNPQRDPLKFGGDTPTGEVIVDGVVDLDPNSKYVDESGTAVDQTFSTNPPKDIKAYGRYFISLKPVAGQFLESSKTRSGIGGHGGGTKLGNRAIVSKQNLVATMGCLRFTNQTAAQLYNQGKDALNNKREFRWIIKEK